MEALESTYKKTSVVEQVCVWGGGWGWPHSCTHVRVQATVNTHTHTHTHTLALSAQVWVYGNSFESCLVAVVVPAKDVITAWAKEQGVTGEFEKGLLEDPRVNAHVLAVS